MDFAASRREVHHENSGVFLRCGSLGIDTPFVVSGKQGPTRWGRFGFSIQSHMASGVIAAQVHLPPGFEGTIRLCLRAPENALLKSVTLNGKPWNNFDPQGETVTIPPGTGTAASIVASYESAFHK